jgi:hypothetical protein
MPSDRLGNVRESQHFIENRRAERPQVQTSNAKILAETKTPKQSRCVTAAIVGKNRRKEKNAAASRYVVFVCSDGFVRFMHAGSDAARIHAINERSLHKLFEEAVVEIVLTFEEAHQMLSEVIPFISLLAGPARRRAIVSVELMPFFVVSTALLAMIEDVSEREESLKSVIEVSLCRSAKQGSSGCRPAKLNAALTQGSGSGIGSLSWRSERTMLR